MKTETNLNQDGITPATEVNYFNLIGYFNETNNFLMEISTASTKAERGILKLQKNGQIQVIIDQGVRLLA